MNKTWSLSIRDIKTSQQNQGKHMSHRTSFYRLVTMGPGVTSLINLQPNNEMQCIEPPDTAD